MHIHQAQVGSGPLAKDLVGGLEGGVDRRHEQLTLHIADQHLALLAQVVAEPTPPRCARWIVVRAQDRSMVVEARHHLALIPDVIAGGQHVDAQAEEVVRDLWRQAEAAGRILAIGDH